MTKKIYIKTYGCQMNEYDSEKIFDLFTAKLSFIKTATIEEADLIILNTCSIREKAQEKLFSDLGRMKKLKKKRPEIIIAVGGCVAMQEKENVFKRAPYVDIVFGPQTLHRLPQMYAETTISQQNIIDTSFPAIEKFDYLFPSKTNNFSACVSIMEGCNNFCSYCVVPYTRGREISRPVADVINEIKILAQQNVKEITLLGQNVNNYCGTNNKTENLAQLLYRVAEINTIERIRIMTSNPTTFGDDLILAYQEIPQIVSHLHLPVQSGSDNILKAMRRDYTIEKYKEIVAKLRKARSNISISSDFIVGFPNETEQDFTDTLNLVHEINFDTSYSFIYSPRPHTTAAKIKDNVPFAEKQLRLQILQSEIILSAKKIRDAMIGTKQRLLVTENSSKNKSTRNIVHLRGRTDNNRGVDFTSDKNLIGQMIEVKIVAALANSLQGEILDD